MSNTPTGFKVRFDENGDRQILVVVATPEV